MDLYAQDTIYFRTRELKPAKVEEVGPTLTKYKNNKIPDGPVYIIKTADLDSIKYKNGTTDRFNKSSAEMSQVGFTTDNRIKLIGKRYVSQGRKIKHKKC